MSDHRRPRRPRGARPPEPSGPAGRRASADQFEPNPDGAKVRFRPGRRRRWPHRILVGVNVIVATAIIGVASAYGYIDFQLGRITRDTIGSLHTAAAGQPFTMLIVGSDSRSLSDAKNYGGSLATPGQRSDTIMLARVVPAVRQITLMSIPRDLYVQVQGYGQTRINSAFNTGASLLVQTIQTDLGIPINHYVEVNFDSFQQITAAVGGVHVWFPTAVRDFFSGLMIHQAGCVELDGGEALAFVRSRHYEYYQNGEFHPEAASDLARIQRQQAFVKRMVDKAQAQFTNPVALNDIVSGITKNLTLDSKFSTGLILSLAKTFRGINSAAIPTATLPVTPVVINGADVLNLAPEARADITAFNDLGTPAEASASSTSSSTAVPTSTKAPANAPSPSSVSVEVLNGSGVTGQAGQATAALTSLGYKASINSASRSYGSTSNEVRYAPDALASAQLLASKLSGGATLTLDPTLTATSFNLELITGPKYAGLAKAGSVTPTTATPSTTAPPVTALGTSTASYVLPGTPPGQLPPASCTP